MKRDPEVDQSEVRDLVARGYRGLLLLPLAHDGTTTGLLACYARFGRPWSRGPVARARATAEARAQTLNAAAPARD